MAKLNQSVFRALVLGIVVYFVMLGFLYSFQSKLIYLPDLPSRTLMATPASIGLDYQDVILTAEDGTSLHSWFIPTKNNNAVALVYHGNAGNISHRLATIKILNQIDMSVLIFDYRGYGQSEGEPDEIGTYQDGRAAWRYLLQNYRANQIVIFARSLGGGVATELARDLSKSRNTSDKPAALILESTFTSVAALGQELYPVFPVDLLTTIHYDSLAKMKDIAIPTLFIHSPDDEIIPYSHGRALFNAAREPKQFYSLQGDHNSGFQLSLDYPQILKDFISQYISI